MGFYTLGTTADNLIEGFTGPSTILHAVNWCVGWKGIPWEAVSGRISGQHKRCHRLGAKLRGQQRGIPPHGRLGGDLLENVVGGEEAPCPWPEWRIDPAMGELRSYFRIVDGEYLRRDHLPCF